MMRYVVLVAALAACTRTTAQAGLVVSGAMTLSGIMIGETASDQGIAVTPSELGWALAVTGAIAAIPFLAVLSSLPPEPNVDPGEARRREIRDHREQAWQLTQAAAAAATDGRCNVAIDLGPQIAAIDADFHDSVYMHNVAIARCMAQ